MAQLKDTTVSGDLTVSGDALIQGDVKVNGKLNNEILDVDDNCIIIDVCRRLDLSTVGNKIEIALPDGYVCNSTDAARACLGFDTWGLTGSWSTNAAITISCVNYQDDNVYSTAATLNKNSYATKSFIPFAKSYIKVEVTTAAVGTETYALISGRIFCKKIA